MRGVPPWVQREEVESRTTRWGDSPVFTVPEGMGGKYLVSWHGTLLASTTATAVHFKVDGDKNLLSVYPPHDGPTEVSAQRILDLAAGDVVSVHVNQPVDGARTVVQRVS